MRTRHRELMWSALPMSTSFFDPYLIVYTKISVDIYDVPLGVWVQSLPLFNTFPLTPDGSVSVSYDPELVEHHGKLIYITQSDWLIPSLNISEKSSTTQISGPTNFKHLEHLGRDVGLKILSSAKYCKESYGLNKKYPSNALDKNELFITADSTSHGSVPTIRNLVQLV